MGTPLRLIPILLLAALPLAGESLPTITLEEAISSAKESNIQLEIDSIELEKELRSADAVMQTFMPDISLSATVSASGSSLLRNSLHWARPCGCEYTFLISPISASFCPIRL